MLKKILIFFTVFGVIFSNFSFAEEAAHTMTEKESFQKCKEDKKELPGDCCQSALKYHEMLKSKTNKDLTAEIVEVESYVKDNSCK